MTGAFELFVVLLGVYLLQCIAWTSRGGVAFRVDFKLNGKPVHRFLTIRRAEYRLFLVNPLSPLSGAIVCEAIPTLEMGLSAGSEWRELEQTSGITAEGAIVVPRRQKEAVHAVGRDIFAGKALVYKANSRVFANILAGLLQRVSRAAERERDRVLGHEYEKMFDVSRAASRVAEYKVNAGFLRTITVVVFVFFFGIAPLEIRLLGLGRSWPFLVAYLVTGLVCTSWAFFQAHRVIYPGQKEERWQHALTFTLSPFSAMRANDVLLRDLLCGFHPLAVAHVLLSEEEFRIQAERELRGLKYRGGAARPNEGMQAALEAFIYSVGLSVDDLLKPPPRQSPRSRAYCPLCLSQFVVGEGECPDCTGVTLQRYSSNL